MGARRPFRNENVKLWPDSDRAAGDFWERFFIDFIVCHAFGCGIKISVPG
jgi:hypothetical protein